jgi:hypothetical protein
MGGALEMAPFGVPILEPSIRRAFAVKAAKLLGPYT